MKMPEHTPAPTPSRAVYGFVMFLSFQIFFIIYVIWAIIPEEYFEHIGITFLPQRYWAIAIPIYLLTVLTIFAFFIYPSLGLCMTPNVDDLKTIKDKISSEKKLNGTHLAVDETKGTECICKDKEKCFKEQYESFKGTTVNKAIPLLQDLEIWDVSESLYLK